MTWRMFVLACVLGVVGAYLAVGAANFLVEHGHRPGAE